MTTRWQCASLKFVNGVPEAGAVEHRPHIVNLHTTGKADMIWALSLQRGKGVATRYSSGKPLSEEVPSDGELALIKFANEFGAQGWEPVAVTAHFDGEYLLSKELFFRRPC